MPIYFLFDLKNGDMAATFVFDPHDNTVLAYSSKIVQDFFFFFLNLLFILDSYRFG